MRFFDVHCHLQDERFSDRVERIIAEAKAAGVEHFGCNSTSEKDWDKVQQLAEQHPEVVPHFGLHPWYVAGRSAQWLDNLRQRLLDVPHAGLGECGLDKVARMAMADLGTQEQVFRAQLALAQELRRPVAVHCVKAFGRLLEIVQELGRFPAGLILHSWAGPAEMVGPLAAVEGVYFSLSGSLTRSGKPRPDMLRKIPLERLLLETDCPDALPRTQEDDGDPAIPTLVVPNPFPPELAEDAHGASCFDAAGGPGQAHNGSEERPAGIRLDRSSMDISMRRNRIVKAGQLTSAETLNHPANIRVVLEVVAELMGQDRAVIADAAFRNACKLFPQACGKQT